MHLGELGLDLPIGGHHAMTSIVDLVAQVVQNEPLRLGPQIGVETVIAEELVGRAGRDPSFENWIVACSRIAFPLSADVPVSLTSKFSSAEWPGSRRYCCV